MKFERTVTLKLAGGFLETSDDGHTYRSQIDMIDPDFLRDKTVVMLRGQIKMEELEVTDGYAFARVREVLYSEGGDPGENFNHNLILPFNEFERIGRPSRLEAKTTYTVVQ